jgi:hypothetical protein
VRRETQPGIGGFESLPLRQANKINHLAEVSSDISDNNWRQVITSRLPPLGRRPCALCDCHRPSFGRLAQGALGSSFLRCAGLPSVVFSNETRACFVTLPN